MGKVVNQVKLTIPSQSQPHLGEKIEKYAKMAVLTQSKPLFWPNLPLWVIFSHIGVKQFEKVGKLKTFADVPPPPSPPEMKIFEISPKMRCFGGKRWGNVVNQVKLTIPSQSQPHFGGKDRQICKNGHFDPI